MINKKIIYTGVLAGLLLSLISCRNLFSQKKNPSEETDSVIISGKISTQDIRVEPDYDNSSVIVGLDPTIYVERDCRIKCGNDSFVECGNDML